MALKVVIGADHGGFAMKAELVERLKSSFDLIDVGASSFDPLDDYPAFARAVGLAVTGGKAERGILICGSGVGACIAANKLPGVRACLCHDFYSAHQGVEHDDMNVLCLGARVIGIELAADLSAAFLNARFLNTGKYLRRVNQISALERELREGKGPY